MTIKDDPSLHTCTLHMQTHLKRHEQSTYTYMDMCVHTYTEDLQHMKRSPFLLGVCEYP